MNIIKYTHIALAGSDCMIEASFKATMDILCGYAAINSLKLYITSSKRESTIVKGAIVTPAEMSNHLVGHAVDCDIEDGKAFWNSTMLGGVLTGNVKAFINLVQNDKRLRWGGDFAPVGDKRRDVVHFDDGLNIHSPDIWHQLHELRTVPTC